MKKGIIDREQIMAVLEVDPAEITAIIDSVFENIPSSVGRIRDLLSSESEDNKEDIIILAHSLRGETATLGLYQLSCLFTELEENLDNLVKDEIEKILEDAIDVNQQTLLEFNKSYRS